MRFAPVVVQHRGHPGDGAHRHLGEHGFVSLFQAIQRAGDVFRAGDIAGRRGRVVVGVGQQLGGPDMALGVPLRPGEDVLELRTQRFKALVMAFRGVRGARLGVGRRRWLTCAIVRRVIRFQRRAVFAVGLGHVFERACAQMTTVGVQPLADVVAFALVGDRHHDVQRSVQPQLGVGQRRLAQQGGTVRVFFLRMALAGGVEQIALHRRLAAGLLRGAHLGPQRLSILILQRQIARQAFIHMANGAKHRQRIAGLPVGERRLREILARAQFIARLFFWLLDGAHEINLVVVQRLQIHPGVLIAGGVLEVDNMRNHRFVRAITGPAPVGVHQRRGGEIRLHPQRGGDIAGHLQVQHLLNEHAEHQIEGFFRRRLRLGAGRRARPLAALVILDALAVDLVRALNRIHSAHVQRNGEQLHADRRLNNGGGGGLVGGEQSRIAPGEGRRRSKGQVQLNSGFDDFHKGSSRGRVTHHARTPCGRIVSAL